MSPTMSLTDTVSVRLVSRTVTATSRRGFALASSVCTLYRVKPSDMFHMGKRKKVGLDSESLGWP